MVNLNTFSIPSYRNGNIVMCLFFLGMSSIWVLVPIYLQQALGFSAFAAGFMGVPASLSASWASHRAGSAVGHYGINVVIAGITVSLLGLFLAVLAFYLNAYHNISIWWLAVALGVFGFVQGTKICPNQALTLTEIRLDYSGSAGAVVQTGQRIGTSVGIAVITAIVFTLQAAHSWMLAMIVGFISIFLIISLSLMVSLLDRKRLHLESSEIQN